MLRLLLDEHISPDVADRLLRGCKGLVVHPLADWESGEFLGREDDAILAEATRRRLTPVTYDRRTLPLLLKAWAEEGRTHGGVIFVDERTISPSDSGGLGRALSELVTSAGHLDWMDRVVFLQR